MVIVTILLKTHQDTPHTNVSCSFSWFPTYFALPPGVQGFPIHSQPSFIITVVIWIILYSPLCLLLPLLMQSQINLSKPQMLWNTPGEPPPISTQRLVPDLESQRCHLPGSTFTAHPLPVITTQAAITTLVPDGTSFQPHACCKQSVSSCLWPDPLNQLLMF